MEKKRKVKNLVKLNILYLFAIISSHLYPLITLLISLLILIVLVIFFKEKKIFRNHLIFFLFVYWPCCFCTYLRLFVQAVIDQNLLLNTYEGPIYIKMNLESVGFWAIRVFAISTIKLPLLDLEINSIFFRQFIIETYFWTAVFCDSFGINCNLPLTF